MPVARYSRRRRRPTYRRRPVVRRRTARRRPYARISRTPISLIPHRFKRTFQYAGGYATTTANTPYYNAAYFKLSDLNAVVDWTTMYDMYQFTGVKAHFMFNTNSANVVAGAPLGFWRLYTVVDYNDATVPTAYADLQNHYSYREQLANRDCVRFFRPKALDTIDQGAGSSSYITNNRPQWIKMASDNGATRHYGLKWCLLPPPGDSTSQCSVAINLTYYFKCKGVD